MNHRAKSIRIISGVVILLNLVAFALPLTQIHHENYPKISYSSFRFMIALMKGELPYIEKAINTQQMVWLIFFVALPGILSVIAGIWRLIGDKRQVISSIFVFLTLGLYSIMNITIGVIYKKAYFGNTVNQRGIGSILYFLFSVIASVLTAIVLGISAKKVERKKEYNSIPEVHEMKEEQQKNYKEEILKEQENIFVPSGPRGVIVGIKGIYKGAQIHMKPNETIRFGRTTDNDLVFVGAHKVSRNHCKIRWDDTMKKYFFTDYSSNGTFIQGEEDCLPQNLEIFIEPGTVIELGDSHNTFRLE